jgi:hypothetical protein
MDDTIATEARLAEGNWSNVGWDLDIETVRLWLEDINDNYDGDINKAISTLRWELITLLTEVIPKARTRARSHLRREDIEFNVVELARLQSMRDHLINWSPSENAG